MPRLYFSLYYIVITYTLLLTGPCTCTVTKSHQHQEPPTSFKQIVSFYSSKFGFSGRAPPSQVVPRNSNGQEMLFSDRYLFRTRITFLTDYDISDRSSVDSMNSSGNHHIKAMFSGFYFLGSLHFTYTGLTYAFSSNQCLFLNLPSGATITARRDAVFLRVVELPADHTAPSYCKILSCPTV